MKFFVQFAAAIFVASLLSGCNNGPNEGFDTRVDVEGRVIWSETFADGGCDWLMSINFSPTNPNRITRPINVPDEFLIDDLEVYVSFNNLSIDFECPNNPDPYPQIDVIGVRIR